MGSLPLPALAVQQNQQSPLETYKTILGLRSLQNQQVTQQQAQQLQAQDIQKNQFEIQDREAGMKAMQQWNGQNQSDLPDLIQKNGGSLDAVLGARQAITKAQTDLTAMNLAQLNVGKTKADYLLGKMQAATDSSVPDEQLPQSVMSAAQESLRDGYLDPQHAQTIQQLTQQYANDPTGLRSHLSLFEKSLQSQSEQFAQAQEAKKTAAAETTAEARKQSSETQANEFTQKMPGGALYAPTVAAATEQATMPAKVATATAEAQAKQPIDVQTEVQKQLALQKMAPAALGNVKPNLIAPATAAYTKAGEDYASAYQASQNMEDFINEAKSGNKEAVKIVPLQGALEITTAQGVHRINRTEVDQYGGAGSLYDKLAGKVGGVLTGKDIPDSVLNDMDALQKTVSQNASTLHANKVATINKAYGSQFEPMKFGESAQPGASSIPGAGLKIGQTVSIKGKQMKITKVHPDGSFDAQP